MTEKKLAADAVDWLESAAARCRAFAVRLGVEYPFLSAPMPGVGGAALAAAVSEAGGLGVLAAQRLSPEALLEAGAELRRLTAKPFAVAIEVPPRERPAPDAAKPLVEGLGELLEDLGLSSRLEDYRLDARPVMPAVEAQLAAALELRPCAVIAVGGGFREPEEDALRAAGVLNIATATNLLEVKVLRAARADAVILQGAEAAGPRLSFEGEGLAPLGLSAFVPAAARILGDTPVIAAGGIAGGRQAAGLAMMGAAGFLAGTALLTAAEARLPAALRKKLALSGAGDLCTMRILCGRPMRLLSSPLTEALADYERALSIPYPAPDAVFRPLARAAAEAGRADLALLPAGESVGRSAWRTAADAVKGIAGWTADA